MEKFFSDELEKLLREVKWKLETPIKLTLGDNRKNILNPFKPRLLSLPREYVAGSLSRGWSDNLLLFSSARNRKNGTCDRINSEQRLHKWVERFELSHKSK